VPGHLDVREDAVAYVEVERDFVPAEGVEALDLVGRRGGEFAAVRGER